MINPGIFQNALSSVLAFIVACFNSDRGLLVSMRINDIPLLYIFIALFVLSMIVSAFLPHGPRGV